jgi:hypothetical protein
MSTPLLNQNNNNQYEASGSISSVASSDDILLGSHSLPNDANYMEKMTFDLVADTNTQIAVLVGASYIVRRRLGDDIEVVFLDFPSDQSNNAKYTNGSLSTPSGYSISSQINTSVEPQTAQISISHDLSSAANIYATGHICTNNYN